MQLQLDWTKLAQPIELFHLERSLAAFESKGLIERIGIDRAAIQREFECVMSYANTQLPEWNDTNNKQHKATVT